MAFYRTPLVLIISLFAASQASGVGAGELAPEEKQIAAYVDEHFEEAVSFFKKVVDINSGTLNADGVREVGRVFREAYDAMGFTTRWIDFPDQVQRGGHLFAERRGERGRRLLLIGHLDTVFERDSPFQRFTRDGNWAAGPGVADMKGGDVVMLLALQALHHVGALEGAAITVVLTGDEERPGEPLERVREPLIEAARRSDIALGFEGAVGIQNATVARRGASGWTLKTKGIRGHSGQIFTEEYGAGAVFEAARILSGFYEQVRTEQYLTFNPGLILGGTKVELNQQTAAGTAFGKTNVIAQEVIVRGGLRFITEEQKQRAREKMREIVRHHLPGTSAEITFEDSYPAMEPKEANTQLMKILDQVSRDLGYGPITPLDPSRRGAADISFVASMVDALSGLGPVGSGAHSVEERLDLSTIKIAAQRAAVLMYRLTR